jgi:hypothetical protein
MRDLVITAVVLSVTVIGGLFYLQTHPYTPPAPETPAAGTEAPGPDGPKPGTSTPVPVPATPAGRRVTLFLKNGGTMSGELIAETPESITLRRDYGDVVFRREEIERMIRPRD